MEERIDEVRDGDVGRDWLGDDRLPAEKSILMGLHSALTLSKLSKLCSFDINEIQQKTQANSSILDDFEVRLQG
jgi:hypothetical protein